MSNAVQGPFVRPTITGGGQNMPAIGIGTPPFSTRLDPSAVKSSILDAIKLGYRHIQTTISSFLEHKASGEAIAKAIETGLVNARDELFVTCKIRYMHEAGSGVVVQDLNRFLENVHIDYVDLCLVEWPKSEEDERVDDNIRISELMLVWSAMEECQTLGLTKSIGVCNFSANMLKNVLKNAKIPPCVNQTGIHKLLREKELRQFCLDNKISIIASSTTTGENEKRLDFTHFMELEGLEKFPEDRHKTSNQVIHKWAHEQGAALLLESLSKEHMHEIINIFK